MATLAQIVKEATKGGNYETVELIEGNEKTRVRIKKYITLEEHTHMVRSIAETVFVNIKDKDGEITGQEYDPSYLWFSRYYNLINYYAEISNFDNAERINELIYKTDLIDKIYDVVGERIINATFAEADKLIEAKRKKAEDLGSIIENIIAPFSEVISKKLSGIPEDELMKLVEKTLKEE